MCKTKLEDKTVGIFARIAKFASSSQALRNSQTLRNLFASLANLAMQLRIWQWCCEVGNGVAKLAMWLRSWQGCLRSWQCEISLSFWKFYVRSEVRKCTVNVVSEFRNAN